MRYDLHEGEGTVTDRSDAGLSTWFFRACSFFISKGQSGSIPVARNFFTHPTQVASRCDLCPSEPARDLKIMVVLVRGVGEQEG
jgi:hypothetical protein